MSKPSVGATLRQQLSRIFGNPQYRPPPLPAVALEILELSGRGDVDVEEIVRVLERDPMLAGATMRLVVSPIYAGRSPVRSLREAVIRMGVRTVRDLVFQAALKQTVFSHGEYHDTMERLGRHATASAYLTRAVCRQARVAENQTFLCALLHDIGFAALLFSASEGLRPLPPLAELWPEVDALHEQASRTVAKLWGLPAELATVIGNHHHQHTGSSSHTAAVVTIADALSERFDANVIGPPAADGAPLPACLISKVELDDSRSVLGLQESAFERIASDAAPTVTQALA